VFSPSSEGLLLLHLLKRKQMIFPENEQSPGSGNPSMASLIIENEILMMKLNAEFGAAIFLPDERVSPEIENHFLRSVYEFEQKVASGVKAETIFERIGRPALVPETLLDSRQIQVELNKIIDLLLKHRIVLDVLATYPRRVIYRFLTQEFLNLRLEGIGDDDCMMHFCYEDFHPNHDFDLRQAARYFAAYFTDEIVLVPQNGLYTTFTTSAGLTIGYKEAIAVIQASMSEFEDRRLTRFDIRQVKIAGSHATVSFCTAYEGILAGGEIVLVEGQGKFDFVYSEEIWWITSLVFPGIVI
jgi:hypothetical protein